MIHFIQMFAEYVLHIDDKLPILFSTYGTMAFLLLFLVEFCETGLVVVPFLPGDSLIFAVGAVAQIAGYHVLFAYVLLLTAAISGNLVNYFIGLTIGQKIMDKPNHKFIKVDYLYRAQKFYDKYGSIAIILSRFMPIIRTFAPFIAGIGKMKFSKYFIVNLIGSTAWVTILLFTGFFFGNIPIVKNNFEVVILGIIAISLLPIVIAAIKSKMGKVKSESDMDEA